LYRYSFPLLEVILRFVAGQLAANGQQSVLRKPYSGVYVAVGIDASTLVDDHYLWVVARLILSSRFSRISSFWLVSLFTV
jgi:hypothetical protein